MKTKLIEWLNERVKECGGKIQAFPSVKIAINGQSEAYRNTLAKISELDYLESWPQGKGRFEDLTEAESEIVLQKLKAISSLATTDLDEEQKKRLTEIFMKFGNGETGISTEILTEAAQKGVSETPTLLTWSETDEGITATYNGVKIAVIAYFYRTKAFHHVYPYPIYDVTDRRSWKTLEQAQTAMQENFDVFYKKYKSIFQ